MKKYLVFGGMIKSKNDRQLHFISARQVAELYRVNPSECIFITKDTPINPVTDLPYGLHDDGLVKLYPKRNGNYEVPRQA